MPEIDVVLHGNSVRLNTSVGGYCSVILIKGTKTTLVDAGHVGRRPFLENALAQRGIRPEDIDVTVMTHAHWDHGQNFDLFSGAPMLIHPVERKYARRPHRNDWATPQWTGAMIDWQPNVQEVEDGYQIEPGVTIIHTPGHSPGSISLQVETDQGEALITGDVLHTGGVALSRVNPLVFWNADQAKASIDRIVEIADVIYPGHDRPFRLAKGGVEYLAPQDLVLAGIDLTEPGVRIDLSPRPSWVMPGIEEQRPEDFE